MGEELCDVDINLAQRLLRVQLPELGGLQSTLLQQKEAPIPERKEKMLQIIHCGSRHHWIVVTMHYWKQQGQERCKGWGYGAKAPPKLN